MGYFPGKTMAQPHRTVFDQPALRYLYILIIVIFINWFIFIVPLHNIIMFKNYYEPIATCLIYEITRYIELSKRFLLWYRYNILLFYRCRNRTPDSDLPSYQDDQFSDLHQIRAVDRQRKGLFADMAGEISFWVILYNNNILCTILCALFYK